MNVNLQKYGQMLDVIDASMNFIIVNHVQLLLFIILEIFTIYVIDVFKQLHN